MIEFPPVFCSQQQGILWIRTHHFMPLVAILIVNSGSIWADRAVARYFEKSAASLRRNLLNLLL
jgi:hypothetical protein